MSIYLNKGNDGFAGARHGDYIDKSGMISIINATLETERRFSCVSRSRRFGKSMAARMLCAYYDESCDSHILFDDLQIHESASYSEHLNKYPVIYVDITDFTTRYRTREDIISRIQSDLKQDILSVHPDAGTDINDDLMSLLTRIRRNTGNKFIMIIDEWDAVLREFEDNTSIIDTYVDLLRRLFKGSASMDVFAGVYMTGILPIKKYKTESALNNFREYSMISPGPLARYFGFTRAEMKSLCCRHGADLDEMEKWYDGYRIGDESAIFNPYSVMEAIANGRIRSYWSETGSYEPIRRYIMMNFDGLKDDVIRMLAGSSCRVNTTKFQNDMSVIGCRDDVLTALIHLGYLSYDWDRGECRIPNKEVAGEFANAVEDTSWKRLSDALRSSEDLLKATLLGREDTVARGVALAHDANTSILSYNDENSLACVLAIAYYYAQNEYIILREFASGKGYADLVLIPRRPDSSPALVIELKVDKSADSAIDQIKRKEYTGNVSEFTGNILLVGISYDRQSRQHTCRIEKA